MKVSILIICFLILLSCKENKKSKTLDNLKSVDDTSVKVDGKTKTMLNHKY